MIKNMLSHFEPQWFAQDRHSKVFTNAPAGLIFPGDDGFPGQSDTSQRLAQFSPRVGIVYDPRGKGQETIRAGYGVFYETSFLWQMMYFCN
jgi:hypothetical protein